MASTLFAGLAVLAAAPALAQSTEPTTGNTQTSTTESTGQKDASTRVVPNAGGVNAPGGGEVTSGEVVVTGSRIARRDYVADSPIVSVGPKAIENAGSVTLDKLLDQVPQFVPGLGTQSNNPGDGQVNVDLRGLGPTRTLVLLDGRRITPSNVDGVVDINTIPQALLDNIEVVTGGQSTSYGSDAIAGVLNFKLKHNFQGVVVDALYGRDQPGDGPQQGVNVTAGSNFDNDRGNAVLSLGYSNRDALFYGQRANVTRSDFATISSAVTDPRILAVSGLSGTKPQGSATFLAPNLPNQTVENNLFAGYGYAGGVNNTFSLGFNNDGTLFNGPANYRGPTSIDYSTIPGSGVRSNAGFYNTGALNYIQLPITRYNAYSSAEYAITPHIKAYGQFIFTDYTTNTLLAPSPGSGNPAVGGTGFLVGANNPFISNDFRTILNSRTDPNAPFILNKRFSSAGGRNSSDEFTNYQSLIGIKGDVPGYDLTYDIFASYGHFNDSNTETGNISHTNLAAVLVNPTTAGGGACTTYNPFGISTLTGACSAFLSPVTKNQTTYTQKIVEGDFQGKAFDIPSVDLFGGSLGGPVRFAFGLDYRSDQANFSPDALLSSQDQSTNSYTMGGETFNLTNDTVGVVGFNGAQPVSGRIDVYETYGELLIPIAKDLPGIKSLNLDVGGRYSDYSTVGSLYTYKADLEWRVTDWLLLRGGYSRAVRAPNVSELFSPATNGFDSIGAPDPNTLNTGDPCDVGGAARAGKGVDPAKVRALCLAQGVPASVIDTFQGDNTQVQTLTGGNPNLKAERTNTYTGGFVISPKFNNPMFRHISASVDYFNIEINGYVTSVGPSSDLEKCFNEDGSNPTYSNSFSLCSNFSRDPATGQITSGTAVLQNIGAIRTSGIDFQIDWNFALSTIPYANLSDRFGSLAFNLTASWLNDFDEQLLPGDPFLNYRDSIGPGPDNTYPVWKAFLNADYSIGPVELGFQEQYIGNARDQSCVGITTVCTARGVDPEFYSNFNARWKINDTLELRGTLSNAFNQDPRFFASASASEGQTNAATYDLIGRAFTIALKARF